MKRYESLEHTADMLIRAYGDSLAEAYAASADALFDIITGHAVITPETSTSFEIEGMDAESLLVRFLSELIVRHEVDRVVMGNFEVNLLSGRKLTAVADVEAFSEQRHAGGMHVKAVAYHLLEISGESPLGQSSVQVLFDI